MTDVKPFVDRLVNRRDRFESPSLAHEMVIERARKIDPDSVLRHWDALDLAIRLAWVLEQEVQPVIGTDCDDLGARCIADQAVSLAISIATRTIKQS